eukprot:GFUD01030224.1.p1 GENE.GFUD01030224.1~~GFUD01030224.1.p1  ORF type:complete len:190 (-),score=42.20 GFUD01030224.1:45-614(-)
MQLILYKPFRMFLISIIVICSYFVQTCTSKEQPCAQYYDNGDFSGSSELIFHGEKRVDTNQQISSIEVMEDCELTGYSDDNYSDKIVRIKSCSGTKQSSLKTDQDNSIRGVSCVCTGGLCEWTTTSIVAIAIPVTLVILAVCVGLGMFVKKKKEIQEEEAVDYNPEYGYDDPDYEYKETKIEDKNDYYD